jgi:hypothetical protein
MHYMQEGTASYINCIWTSTLKKRLPGATYKPAFGTAVPTSSLKENIPSAAQRQQ